MGFAAPVLYQIGNSSHSDSYFRDIQCGNTANPTSGPYGDAARLAGMQRPAGVSPTGSTSPRVRAQLGATNVSPAGVALDRTSRGRARRRRATRPSARSSSRRSRSATPSARPRAHAVVRQVPRLRRLGRREHVLQDHRRRPDLVPVEQRHVLDRVYRAATSCVKSGAGGRERTTTDGGTTWTDVATATGNNKPLTQVTCPSSSICYAVGDRGNAMKSTRRRPDVVVVARAPTATRLRPLLPGHLDLLRDRHLRPRLQDDRRRRDLDVADDADHDARRDVPSPAARTPWGGLMAISCSDDDTCVASGLYAPTSPARRTRRIRRSSRRPTAARRGRARRAARAPATSCTAVSCLPGTQTCTAVGRGGRSSRRRTSRRGRRRRRTRRTC